MILSKTDFKLIDLKMIAFRNLALDLAISQVKYDGEYFLVGGHATNMGTDMTTAPFIFGYVTKFKLEDDDLSCFDVKDTSTRYFTKGRVKWPIIDIGIPTVTVPEDAIPIRTLSALGLDGHEVVSVPSFLAEEYQPCPKHEVSLISANMQAIFGQITHDTIALKSNRDCDSTYDVTFNDVLDPTLYEWEYLGDSKFSFQPYDQSLINSFVEKNIHVSWNEVPAATLDADFKVTVFLPAPPLYPDSDLGLEDAEEVAVAARPTIDRLAPFYGE